MSGPILFVGSAPEFQEASGLFLVTFQSGDSFHQFAMPRHAIRAFAERARLKLNELEAMERLREPVSIARSKPK